MNIVFKQMIGHCYNGYDYAPVVVSFGTKDTSDIINKEKQELFYSIYKIAKDEIKVNE